jgi:hypothetical protein
MTKMSTIYSRLSYGTDRTDGLRCLSKGVCRGS